MACQSSCRETESSYKTQQAEAQPSAAESWAAPLEQLVGNGLLKGIWAEECYPPDLIKPVTLQLSFTQECYSDCFYQIRAIKQK